MATVSDLITHARSVLVPPPMLVEVGFRNVPVGTLSALVLTGRVSSFKINGHGLYDGETDELTPDELVVLTGILATRPATAPDIEDPIEKGLQPYSDKTFAYCPTHTDWEPLLRENSGGGLVCTAHFNGEKPACSYRYPDPDNRYANK